MANSGEPTLTNQLLAEISSQRNAQILEYRKRYAEKYPDSMDPAAVAAALTEYQIKIFEFDYWALFYIRLHCSLTYATGESFQFQGDGGGVGLWGGIYTGGGPGQKLYVPPSELPGQASFFFLPEVFGALLHFWRGATNIGSLVGGGISSASAGFGGSGTWSRTS